MTRDRRDPPHRGWVPVPREARGPFWALVRRRAEIGLAIACGGVPGAAWAVRRSLLDVGVAMLLAGAMLALPEFRRFLAGQFRRLVAERRLRAAFRESGPCTDSGLVATAFRSASAASDATVVWLWCPAGLTVEDVAEARTMLAQACFVDDLVVERHRRWPNVAVLTLLRGGLGPPG